ncbi:putative sodium-dependent multivitamin transporter [Ptychodera flava]|uniref:putative sodium-dependent multivitamin transporter n=1 Tax=Ptychodera flava TaxID=63121 RepID=UPI00396A6F21
MNFIDYTIFLLVILFIIFHGIYHAFRRGRQKTVANYFLGDRALKPIPLSVSIFVSCTSAIAILGYPGETYEYGMGFAAFFLSLFWVYPVASCLFSTVYRGLRITSVYEYMGLRFNYASQVICSLLFFVITLFYTGVALMGPAKAFEAVYGMSSWQCVFVVAIVSMVYAATGGILAVVWTDVVLVMLMLVALLIIIIIGSMETGGSAYIWEVMESQTRVGVFNFPVDATERVTFVNSFFGGGLNFLALLITQIVMQRAMSTRSVKETKSAIMLNLPYQCVFQPILFSIGAMMFVFYHGEEVKIEAEAMDAVSESPILDVESLTSGKPQSTLSPTTPPGLDYLSSDEVLIYFVKENFSYMPGFQGLFFAVVFAGSLSLVSSSLSAMAAISVQDYVRPFRVWKSSGREVIHNEAVDYLLAQMMVIVFGFIVIGVAFAVSSMDSMLVTSNVVLGIFGGPLLAATTMGMLYKRSTQCGVIVGVIVGLAMGVWIAVGAAVYSGRLDEGLIIYSMSFMWYGAWTFCITLIVAIICSELHRCCSKKERELADKLDSQLVALFLRKVNYDLLEVKVVLTEYEVEKLLEEAGEKSKQLIAEARKKKTTKIREAPKLAKDEIVAYSKERKTRFDAMERRYIHADDSRAREIEMNTRQKIKTLNDSVRRNKDHVLDAVMSMIYDIRPIVHQNYKSDDKDD